MTHKYFSSGQGRTPTSEDGTTIAAILDRALRPLALSVGLNDAALEQAIERDLSRRVARSAFNELEQEGVRVVSARVLDSGAGLGHVSLEAIDRGCEVFSIEPGFDWCSIVAMRMSAAGGGNAIVSDGERLPFPDGTFDIVLSVGVLEHVRSPGRYLSEAYRVLKPGGSMFLSCENYLSFWEPHYQLRWLPLFPKRIAAAYLRVRGRSSEFLLSSITYTTRVGVIRRLRKVGFEFKREVNLRVKLRALLAASRLGNSLQRASLDASLINACARTMFEVENWRRAFTPYFATIVQKPAAPRYQHGR